MPPRLFKAIFDGPKKVKIYASGSSSIEIHKHLKESLTGRRRLVSVFPLSYLELKTKFGAKTSDYYFCFGGLPGVAFIEVKTSAEINEVPAGMRSFLSKYSETKFGVVFTESIEGKAYFGKIPVYYRIFGEKDFLVARP